MKTYEKPILEQIELREESLLALSLGKGDANQDSMSNRRRNRWETGWD